MTNKNNTTLMVKKTTRDRLLNIGNMGETYDELLNRLADGLEKRNTKA